MAPLPPTSAPASPSVDAHVAILGNDTLLAFAPATAIQLAHACLASGFDLAVPASWGDELVASETLRQLTRRHGEPAVLCTCPLVTSRLLAAGADLAPFLVSIVAPPVAVARYLRAVLEPRAVHLTYIGACPAGADPSIDEHLSPETFIARLRERGVLVTAQPLVFDSVVPPDRRRFSSMPGGIPEPSAIGLVERGRALVELRGHDVVTDLAQHLVAQEVVLLDVSTRIGCACGAQRERLSMLEPPRSPGPVLDVDVAVPLSRPLTTPRITSSDEGSARAQIVSATESATVDAPPPASAAIQATSGYESPSLSPSWPAVEAERELPLESKLESLAAPESTTVPHETPRGGDGLEVVRDETFLSHAPEIDGDRGPRRRRSPPSVPAIGATPPKARAGERSLPRAYVARRRTGNTPVRPMPRFDERQVSEPVLSDLAEPIESDTESTDRAEAIASHAESAQTIDAFEPMVAVEQLSTTGVLIEKVSDDIAPAAEPVRSVGVLLPNGAVRPRSGPLPPIDVPPSPRPAANGDASALAPRGERDAVSAAHEPTIRERLAKLPALVLLGLVAVLAVTAAALLLRR